MLTYQNDDMNFKNSEAPVTDAAIAVIEKRLGFRLPISLRNQYLKSNGGTPDQYVYEDDDIDTVISEFLPLASCGGKRTAPDVYEHLVISRALVLPQFFPFAVDGGGDYFFVDCSSVNENVSFFVGDERSLRHLSVGLAEFWARLKQE